MNGFVFVALCLVLLSFGLCDEDAERLEKTKKLLPKSALPSESKKEQLRRMKLAPCQACRQLVESFKKGMGRTERGKFEGGDSAWEEEKMKKYATSEIRLIEVQEQLCSEIETAQEQCRSLAENHESDIETWWFKHQDDIPDLHKYLCIDTMKVCCPVDHYGPDCLPCPGYPDNICNKNGKCKGNSTRKGSGKCTCDPGYINDFCNECAGGYFAAYKDENKLLCSPCHPACSGTCTKAGPGGCTTCNAGWKMNSEKNNCEDIDECVSKIAACDRNQFCINNEGSYQCWNCDRSCSGCVADGPDMCVECADGYVLKDGACIDKYGFSRKTQGSLSRYLTYFGLCCATFIIFQKNVLVACLVGFAVAVYISASEYIIKES